MAADIVEIVGSWHILER